MKLGTLLLAVRASDDDYDGTSATGYYRDANPSTEADLWLDISIGPNWQAIDEFIKPSPKRIFLDWLGSFRRDHIITMQYHSLFYDNRLRTRLQACRVSTRRDMKSILIPAPRIY